MTQLLNRRWTATTSSASLVTNKAYCYRNVTNEGGRQCCCNATQQQFAYRRSTAGNNARRNRGTNTSEQRHPEQCATARPLENELGECRHNADRVSEFGVDVGVQPDPAGSSISAKAEQFVCEGSSGTRTAVSKDQTVRSP